LSGTESEGLKCQFSQVQGDLDLQEFPKLIPISNKKEPRKKAIVLKEENEKMKKLERRLIVCNKSKK
jgi:hypothetical protein